MAGVGGREGRVEGREWKHAERALIGIDCCQLKQRDLRECKERSQPVGTDSSRHNIIISTPNTNQWSLFIVTLQTTLMDRQSAHLMTRVQRLLTCAVTDYYRSIGVHAVLGCLNLI